MSVRCLITDGKNYEQNKQFVEYTLKYFPDYDFNIMKATISGWQSSQLKDNEDRLPTIQELINYLQNSAKKERNDRLALITNKAKSILINNQPDKITDGTNYYTQDDINYLHSRNLVINQTFTGNNIKEVLESFKSSIRKIINKYSQENHYNLGIATQRRQKLEGNLSDKDSYYNFIQQLQNNIIDKLQKSGKTIEIKPNSNFTAAMGAKVSGNKVSLVYNPRLLLMDNERLDYILSHELVHIVTSNSINNVTLNIATKEEQQFYDDIWNIIVDLNDNKDFYWDFGYDVFDTEQRGSHIKEFIANVMTNPELQKSLAQIKTDKKQSLWSRFINTIKNLLNKYLGINISDSYLEKLINTISLHIEKSSLQNQNFRQFDMMTEGEKINQRKTYKGMITSLQDNQIFVFGSNTQGKHGAGAAFTARNKFGAKYGQAEGLQGQSYAIITKDLTKDDKKNPSRTKEQIIEQIHKLYEFARQNPNKEFLVAYSGTGKNLNYYSNEEMASMFASEQIPNNIVFEEGFNELVNQQQQSSQEEEKIIQEEQVTPITIQQLNNTEDLDVEKAKATKDFLNPITRRQTVQKLGRMFSNIVSREYNNFKQALDNRIAQEEDTKTLQELLFQRRKLSRFEVIKTLRPTTIFNRLKDTFQQYVNLTEQQGIELEKRILNKNSVFQKMSKEKKESIAKGRFNHKKQQYQIILDNFKVLAMEASKGFALTEGVTLIFNEDSVVQTMEQDTINDEGQSDFSDNKEEKTKEGWMIDVRTVSSFNSLTNRIRQAINNIARVSKNGIQETDNTGDTIYLSGSYVHSELIKALAPVITEPKDMIPILQKLAIRKPWVNQIISKLQDDPQLFTEMYRAYNKSTLNYWIQKPRTQQDGSIKTQTISINKMEGLDELFETWRDNYEYGNRLDDDAIYNSNGEIDKNNVKKGLDLVNEVRQAIYYVRQDTRETRIATVLDKDNVRKITKAFKMLGINLEESTVADAIEYNIGDTRYEPDFNANTLTNALLTIYDDLLKNKDIKDNQQVDLANLYGRALENVAKVISFVTESTMESQVRHNKKSLYAHVNSGYMINLIKKLKNPEKFKAFIEKEYMPVDWFYNRKNKQWRNQLIKNLYNNQEDRDKFNHIVVLDYNGKEYKDWSTLDSTLVLFNQFRSQPTNDDNGWAYYNIPVLSDTESAEFLRMRRYIKDFRQIINKKMINLVLQEIDRIDLVKRRSQDPNVEKIANFDMVKTVDKNGNEHIKKGGAEFKFLPELNFLEINGKSFLDTYYDNTHNMSNEQLNAWIAQQIDGILANRFKKALTKWEQIGLFDRVDDNPNGKLKYFDTNSKETAITQLGEWYWNSTFAQSQIIELLTTDLAFYKTKGNDFLTDFIKRAKEFHAPIERLNTEAEWIVNGERKKVCYDDSGNLMKNRVLYLKDCEVPSLTLDELKEALNKNLKLTQAEKNIIISAYENINMADAQAYRTLDSFRRTQIMAGMWSDEEESSYNNIKNGNFRLEDITTLWNTRKPYLYTQTNQGNQVDEGNIRIPTQHKNSEMVMLTQAVLGTIMSTGKLAALERFMTKNNIDAVMFESAVKTGGQDIIDLNDVDASEVEDYLANYVNENSQAIHEFDYEDYGIQTATPEHGIDAMQLVGTQIRRIIASNQDITDPNFRFKYGNKEWTIQEWQDLYNMVNTANIKDSFMKLDKKFSDIKQIEKLLLSEVRSNPRYDSDIELALTLNKDGVFNIPLLDPSITYKIQSLLTSIVKNRVTKQKIAGGAYIQTSAWGFKREPKVIYNDDGSVKHIECYMPCPSEELYNMLIDKNTGEVDINKKYKGADGKWHYIVPEKYREFIGYRVPTESFYSCAPFKIIGFLPRQVGTIIVVPRDIVSMAGSDYDVDKIYAMLHTLNFKKQYNIKQAWDDFYKSHQEITKEIDQNYNTLFQDFLKTWNEDGEKLDLEDLKDAQSDFKEWLKTNNIKKSQFSETAQDEFNKWFKENKRNYLQNVIPQTSEYKDISKEDLKGDKPTKKELLNHMLNNNNKEQRDSLLIDLMWAVLTNKETTPKLMKPGGFDNPKKAARIATILKNNTIQSLKDKGYNIDTLISDLQNMSVGELTDIVDEMSEVLNPLTPDTWVTLHDRNMAGAALIAIAATNNAGHALIQHTQLQFKKPIQINGRLYQSLHDIKNAKGKYITENIAEFLAAVVDNAKDPIAGDMNLNTTTAGIAFTLLRMGVNATTTALLLSQPIVVQAVEKVAKEKISLQEAFKDICDRMTVDLKSQGKNIPEITNIAKFNFSDGWLAQSMLGYNNMSLSSNNQFERDAMLNQVRVGQLMQQLSKMAQDLTDFTQATRADTQNGGAGPTIADTQINIERYTAIKDNKTSLENWKILISNAFDENDYFSTDDIIESQTPILQAFFTYGLESVKKLFNKLLPYYNEQYLQITDYFMNNNRSGKLSADTRNKIYTQYINYQLSKIVDKRFTNADEQRDYFINKFPSEFEKIVASNKDLQKYDLIKRIVKLNPTKYNPAPALKFNNVGRISDIQRNQYQQDWESLLYINDETRQLAYDLLTYNMYRGLEFSPSGFGHLVPSIVKMTHPYYVRVLNNTLVNSTADSNETQRFFNQFIRNNLHIRELVPDCSDAQFENIEDYEGNKKITISLDEFSKSGDRKVAKPYSEKTAANEEIEFLPYIMRKINGVEHYYQLTDDSINAAEYKEIYPLGKKNKYYEYNGLESDIESVIKPSEPSPIQDNNDTDNEQFNPQENQAAPVIKGSGTDMINMIKQGLQNLVGNPTQQDNNLDKLNSIDNQASDPQTGKPICGGAILTL